MKPNQGTMKLFGIYFLRKNIFMKNKTLGATSQAIIKTYSI